MQIPGKNILITGANRGIGLAFAQRAAQRGAHVHLLGRTQSKEVEAQLVEMGALSVRSWPIDMGDPTSIDQFIKQFLAAQIPPDILINNAGQLTGGLLEEQSVEDIYRMLQVNLGGLIHLTKALLPTMLKLEKAKIVNNSSVSGVMFLPCASTYAASKAGVIAFTESLRNELKGTSVSTLILITPGVKTRMYDEISQLYAKNVDLKFLSSITAEEWVEKCFRHIEKDKTKCLPSGSTYFGVKLGQHFPSTLGAIAAGYFKR